MNYNMIVLAVKHNLIYCKTLVYFWLYDQTSADCRNRIVTQSGDKLICVCRSDQ